MDKQREAYSQLVKDITDRKQTKKAIADLKKNHLLDDDEIYSLLRLIRQDALLEMVGAEFDETSNEEVIFNPQTKCSQTRKEKRNITRRFNVAQNAISRIDLIREKTKMGDVSEFNEIWKATQDNDE